VPSIAQNLTLTHTAWWVRNAQSAYPDSWAERLRCFTALLDILGAYRAPQGDNRWSQPPVHPPALLKEVARQTHFATASVYLRWSAKQPSRSVKRWAGPDPAVLPREAFVAEAKIVSFWPYRAGAIAIADKFEMTLTEIAAAYLRALAAWAVRNPALAACVPAGPPSCVPEDLAVLAARRSSAASAASAASGACGDAGDVTARLTSLAATLLAAVLDDASLTPLGAFNVVRDETMRLLSDPPEPATVKVSNAVSELADRLLHSRAGEQVVTVDQARQLTAEIARLKALLADVDGDGDWADDRSTRGAQAADQ
jgi:hypothetical protein